MEIRKFELGDLKKVCEIEYKSFPDPWSEGTFRYVHLFNPSGFVVASKGEEVVGYAVASLEREIKFKDLQIIKRGHITNLAVAPAHRRQGIGRKLIKYMIAQLKNAGAKEVFLEVRSSNHIGRTFYSSLGFRESGRIKNYYSNEDAIIMSRKI